VALEERLVVRVGWAAGAEFGGMGVVSSEMAVKAVDFLAMVVALVALMAMGAMGEVV